MSDFDIQFLMVWSLAVSLQARDETIYDRWLLDNGFEDPFRVAMGF